MRKVAAGGFCGNDRNVKPASAAAERTWNKSPAPSASMDICKPCPGRAQKTNHE